MKILSATLALAIAVTGMTTRMSYADTDRFAVWDRLETATAELLNEQQIDEYESRSVEEVLGLGRTGETEEAITALNEFLSDSHNSALHEVARETMAELVNQRRANVALSAKRANERSACTMEMKICPDGATVVGRDGPKCTFLECPEID